MSKPLHWDQINSLTGTPFCWDDANLYFDENGFGMYKEPGDPGFVPTPTSSHNPHRSPQRNPSIAKQNQETATQQQHQQPTKLLP